MDQRHLHKMLLELHTELLAARSVDPRSLDLLQRLAEDIRAIVEAKPSPASPSHLRERLTQAVAAVEASHPQLSKTLANMIDTLALYNL
jgi:hypothetical protein